MFAICSSSATNILFADTRERLKKSLISASLRAFAGRRRLPLFACNCGRWGPNQGALQGPAEARPPTMLTDTAIRNAKPREKPYKVSDSQGLYLLVNPRGSKLWRVKYRINGVEWKLAIGPYPEITLAEARAARDAARRQTVTLTVVNHSPDLVFAWLARHFHSRVPTAAGSRYALCLPCGRAGRARCRRRG